MLAAFAMFFPGPTNAQTPCANPTGNANLEANRIRARINAGGNLFNDGIYGEFIPLDPAGVTNPTTIYTASMWIGGVDPGGNLRMSVPTYGAGLWPGPLTIDGTTTAGDCANWDKVFVVDGADIASMLAQLPNLTAGDLIAQYPNIAGWPAYGNPFFAGIHGFDLPDLSRPLAPFYDANGDAVYNPLDGDYPVVLLRNKPPFVPAQIAWTVFNDVGSGNVSDPPFATPVVMETQLTAWAFSCTDQSALNNTIFTSHKLIYLRSEILDSVQVAIFADFDLGCYLDDYQGCNPELNTMFTYNQDVQDGGPGCSPSFPGKVPVQSATLLNLNLDRFMYYENPSVGLHSIATTDPTNALEYYNYMNAHWRDGSPLTLGGTGYNLNNLPPTPYAFPTDPSSVNGWSMCLAGLSLGDRRVLGIHNLGTLMPGAVNEIDVAWTHHPDSDLPCGLGNTFDEITLVQGLFDSGFDGVCSPVTSTVNPSLKGRISLSPNPATDAVTVQYGDVAVQQIQLFDPAGRLVRSYEAIPSENVTLPLSGLQSGMYLLQFTTTGGRWVEKLVVR